MKQRMRRVLSALLCLCLLMCTFVPAACAADAAAGRAQDSARERPALPVAKVFIGGLLSGRAFMRGETAYLSLQDLGRMYDFDLTVSVTKEGFQASAPGLELSGTEGAGYLVANFRYVYLPTGYLSCADDIYLPFDAVCRIFGLSGEMKDGCVSISTAQIRVLSGSKDYYEVHFSADELYWLPRVAYTEAFEQPLAGLMGVCRVVLNRVADEDFPDTIFEVLYDSRHTVQFTPAATGSMHAKPGELYTIAAYLVLEGYNPVGKSLYFVNPANNANYWFRENLAYVTTIGDHEFYR